MPSRRLVSLLLLASCAALAQDGVHVTALKDPVSKSYRKMVEGMDLFEEKRAMAPGATLRFKLLPRKRDTRMDQIQLELVGYSDIKPLELAADRTFTIGRDEQALKEDALVRPNRRAMTMTWRAEIRSPGLPPGTRRLGDLRLECEVGMRAELISNRTAFEKMMDAIFGRDGYCERPEPRYLFFTERPVFAVTLVSGERRELIPVDRLYAGASAIEDISQTLPWCDCEVLLDRTYFLPLGDRSWPNDTLVQFEYMDDAPAPAADGLSTKAEVITALGIGKAVRFDSGYEIRIYRTRSVSPEEKKSAPLLTERVFLFGPTGATLKSRTSVRPAKPPSPSPEARLPGPAPFAARPRTASG
jgi:hypothetical protein